MRVQRVSRLLVLGVLVLLVLLSVSQSAQPARAFEDPDERFSPMVGIARGQTARLNVACDGPDSRPCNVTILFYNSRGMVLTQDAKTLGPGRAAFLDLSYAAIGDPTIRSEIRAKVIGNPNIFKASLEVFDDETGQSSLIIADPWLAH